MAKDATIVIKGSLAQVVKVELLMDAAVPGGYKLAVYGQSQTSTGTPIGLAVGFETLPAGTAVADTVFAHALGVLLAANNLQ